VVGVAEATQSDQTPPPVTSPTPEPAPTPEPSLSEVPEEYQDIVSSEKTLSSGDGFTIDGETGEYNLSSLPNGRSNLPISMSYRTEQGAPATATGTLLVYQQPYSLVTGLTWTQDSGDRFDDDVLGFFLGIFSPLGFYTPGSVLAGLNAQNATFDYTGMAFYGQEEATLNYKMDFGAQQGSGTIAGFASTGLINLLPSSFFDLDNGNLWGEALTENAPKTPEGGPLLRYRLDFFGPNAEEIAGIVLEISSPVEIYTDGNAIIFAGQR